MLVTNPKERATMTEIMNHPWITKGFNCPPENYLPYREPLELPLEPEVVEKMTGFDFGTPEYITSQLTAILQSEEYQNAVRMSKTEQPSQAPTGGEKKRGVFDFYKRRNSISSRENVGNMSVEALPVGNDPVNAYSPLISVYYLCREKRDRERHETNPGGLSMPKSPNERPLKMPDLPAPQAAYTNSSAYEMPGEKTTGGRARPRARTHGEDDVVDSTRRLNISTTGGQPSPAIVTPPTPVEQPKKESTAAGLLRRFSTRRTKERPQRDRYDEKTPIVQIPQGDAPTPPPAPPQSLHKTFSVRRTRNREPSPATLHPGGSQPQHQNLLSPADATAKSSKGLGRSTSVNSADLRRRQASHRKAPSEALPSPTLPDPPLTSGSDRSASSSLRPTKAPPTVATDAKSGLNAQAATTRAKSLGHARRESIQARRERREQADREREADVPEETDADVTANQTVDAARSQENIKPVYLKGLFSVSTTSNKPLPVIRADIIRVLNQLGVQYTEIKGGFSCRHAPSIDLNKVVEPPSPPGASQQTPSHRRRISFGGFKRPENIAQDDTQPLNKTPSRRQPSQHHRQSSSQAAGAAPRDHAAERSVTFTDPDAENSEGSEEYLAAMASQNKADDDAARAAGETTTRVQSDLGGSMVLKFEIFVVKVPLFSLHGIQFKKVSGGTWQYKNMAQKILDALRL